MTSKRTLILKNQGKIVYSVKIKDEVLWEGENVHEVFPELQQSYKNRELSIIWKELKEPEFVK